MEPIHLTVLEEKGDDNIFNHEDIISREKGILPFSSSPKNGQILRPLLVQRVPKKKSEHIIIEMEVSEEEMDKRETALSCTLGNFVSKIHPDLMNTQTEQCIPEYSWEFPHFSPEIAKKIMIFGTVGIIISTVIYLGT